MKAQNGRKLSEKIDIRWTVFRYIKYSNRIYKVAICLLNFTEYLSTLIISISTNNFLLLQPVVSAFFFDT